MSDNKKKGKRRPDARKSGPAKPGPARPGPAKPEVTAPAKPAPEPETTRESKPEAAKPAAPPKKKSLLGTIENVILIIGFLIMFGSGFLGNFRLTVASAIDVIVSPITSSMPFFIVVMAIATIVTVISTFLQKHMMDWELMRSVTERNRRIQKEIREAQLAGNKAMVKKLQEEQMAGMEAQNKVTMQQFKPTGFLAIISVPLFIWAWWYLSSPSHPPLTMVFPFAGMVELSRGAFFIFPWWIVWSILCSFALSQVIRKALNVGIPT